MGGSAKPFMPNTGEIFKKSVESNDEIDFINAKHALQTQMSSFFGEFFFVYSADFCHLCLISRQKSVVSCSVCCNASKKKPEWEFHLKTMQLRFQWPDRPYMFAVYTQCHKLLVICQSILTILSSVQKCLFTCSFRWKFRCMWRVQLVNTDI